MPKPIRDSVIVVTGASSGIGRATAEALARRGARVVVSARRAGPLRDLVREIESRGGNAKAIPADVSVLEDVEELAALAVDAYGGIDAWVNTAATGVFGRFEDIPPDIAHRVMDVVYGGTANCARVALPRLRARGGGVIVNVGSTIGKAPIPFMAPYEAAKAAVTSFTETLRLELKAEPHLHACVVHPPPTDTPFYSHGANVTGYQARPPHPVYKAETVAAAILDALEDPQPEISVGAASKLQQVSLAVSPGAYEAVTPVYIASGLFEDKPLDPTPGNTFMPVRHGTGTSGGYGDDERRMNMGRYATAATVAALLATGGWYLWRESRGGDGASRAPTPATQPGTTVEPPGSDVPPVTP